MQSIWTRVAVLAALAAAVALFIVLSGGNDDDSDKETETAATVTQTSTEAPAEPAVPVIQVRNGQPVGGVDRIELSKGEEVQLSIRLAPPEEEIHVHGYEITESAAKSPVRLRFRADLDGIFEIEVHRVDGSDVQIAELRVNP